jgi:spore coat polysaccharide biosynthesis protein SpsF (cytidylyltransferase family)
MTKVLAIIQARLNSTRLPGKTLMSFGGKTLIEHVYTGVNKASLLSETVVAIPDNEKNWELAEFLKEKGIKFFLGSESDVLDRYSKVANQCSADFVVRIPADNPLPHGNEIDRLITYHLEKNQNGFSSNLSEVYSSMYPDGIGAEIFSGDALKLINLMERTQEQREHVHLNFFNYRTQSAQLPELFTVGSPKCPEDFARPDIVLDINTARDLEYFREMFNYFENITPTIREVITWHDIFGVHIR